MLAEITFSTETLAFFATLGGVMAAVISALWFKMVQDHKERLVDKDTTIEMLHNERAECKARWHEEKAAYEQQILEHGGKLLEMAKLLSNHNDEEKNDSAD